MRLDQGRVVRFDPAPAYIEQIKKLIDLQPIKDAGLKVMLDPMWGNGAGWFPRLLAGGKTQVFEIHNIRNPIFPEMTRPEPIQPNVDVGLRATVENRADVLIITDGDADRLGVGDENGNFYRSATCVWVVGAVYVGSPRLSGTNCQDPIDHNDVGQARKTLPGSSL